MLTPSRRLQSRRCATKPPPSTLRPQRRRHAQPAGTIARTAESPRVGSATRRNGCSASRRTRCSAARRTHCSASGGTGCSARRRTGAPEEARADDRQRAEAFAAPPATANEVLRKAGAAAPLDVASPDRRFAWRVPPTGVVERTTDGGATWTAQEALPRFAIQAGRSPAPDVIWLVGNDGLVLGVDRWPVRGSAAASASRCRSWPSVRSMGSPRR